MNFKKKSKYDVKIEAALEKTVGQVLSNWHPLIETPPKDCKDPTDVNEDSSRKKRKSGNDEDKDEIDNENQKAVKLQRKHFDIAALSYLIAKTLLV